MPDSILSVPSEPSSWPKTVGIISIVWAGLGLLCGVCGVASMLMMGSFTAEAEKQMGPMPEIMKPTMAQIGLMGVGILPTILLLVAGIATLRRKPVGRPLHLVYAVIGLVMAVVGTIISVKHQIDVMEWAKNNQSDKWAKQAGSPMGLIFAGVGLLLSIAWPLFCMLWFGAIKRDNRDLDGGGVVDPGI